jgi:tetratricopeptide (TPR) repeat protein
MGILAAALMALSLADSDVDVIRLRSGKILSGSIQRDESTKEGFALRSWETGGTVFVLWSQLTPEEIDRVLNRSSAPAKAALDAVEGIRIHTPLRTVVGVLIREDADRLSIKTSDSRTPVVVPKSAVIGREDRVAVPESEVYSSEEQVDRRLARIGPQDGEALLGLAALASRLGLFAKAREIYLRVAAADPERNEEIRSLIGATEALARERRASDKLREIDQLARKAEYAAAIAAAKSLQAESGETETARRNKDLVSDLEKEAREWTVHKAEVLARRVPDAWRLKLAEKIAQAARLSKLPDARAAIAGLDDELVRDLAAEMKSTPEEIRTAWSRRERKARKIWFGTGSWIILGGQSGGLDTDAKFIPVHRNTAKPPPPPIPLGVKLDTPEEWWEKASKYERMDWLEAEYGRTSPTVTRTVRDRRCSRCVGEGEVRTSRRGIDCNAKCSRCHGVKADQSVEYQ